MKYPLSKELKKAIESLFDDVSTGLLALGANKPIFPPDWYQKDIEKSVPIEKRAKLLKKKLEKYIINMAAEHEEYSCEEETKRLRAETIATLVALRELFSHIPEAFDDS